MYWEKVPFYGLHVILLNWLNKKDEINVKCNIYGIHAKLWSGKIKASVFWNAYAYIAVSF